jgi:hypothetical protein
VFHSGESRSQRARFATAPSLTIRIMSASPAANRASPPVIAANLAAASGRFQTGGSASVSQRVAPISLAERTPSSPACTAGRSATPSASVNRVGSLDRFVARQAGLQATRPVTPGSVAIIAASPADTRTNLSAPGGSPCHCLCEPVDGWCRPCGKEGEVCCRPSAAIPICRTAQSAMTASAAVPEEEVVAISRRSATDSRIPLTRCRDPLRSRMLMAVSLRKRSPPIPRPRPFSAQRQHTGMPWWRTEGTSSPGR